jgi:ribonucleoside-diphosphate reductase alpha chain
MDEFLHVKPSAPDTDSVSVKDQFESPEEPKMATTSVVSGTNKAYVESRMAGYTGDSCSSCGSMRVRRNGTCTVCDDCGTTSGCS